jgi:hypothetical protein
MAPDAGVSHAPTDIGLCHPCGTKDKPERGIDDYNPDQMNARFLLTNRSASTVYWSRSTSTRSPTIGLGEDIRKSAIRGKWVM